MSGLTASLFDAGRNAGALPEKVWAVFRMGSATHKDSGSVSDSIEAGTDLGANARHGGGREHAGLEFAGQGVAVARHIEGQRQQIKPPSATRRAFACCFRSGRAVPDASLLR